MIEVSKRSRYLMFIAAAVVATIAAGFAWRWMITPSKHEATPAEQQAELIMRLQENQPTIFKAGISWSPRITDKYGNTYRSIWVDEDHVVQAFVNSHDDLTGLSISIPNPDEPLPYATALVAALQPDLTTSARLNAAQSLASQAKAGGATAMHLDKIDYRVSRGWQHTVITGESATH